MKKLKGFLERSAIRLLSVAPIATTFAGGLAGALLAGPTSAAVALACIGIGVYAGFVAGYVGIARAPERLTGLPKQTILQDAKTAALMMPQGAVEFVRLMRQSFNGAARPKGSSRSKAPAPQPKPASAKPSP